MQALAPYKLSHPANPVGGVIFSSPHSGSAYPPELLDRSRLNALELRTSEDAFVDRLFESSPSFGAPLLAATWPRAWVDLNRAPTELDPALIRDVRARGLNQRVAAGLGVVPRIVAEGREIYTGKLSLEEAQDRIRLAHAPFHACLEALIAAAVDRCGMALLFDCHSMPRDALRAAPRIGGRRPEIVLGDRFGASASREIAGAVQTAFESEGFLVARNAPFAGGYITQRYGRPARSVHAIQIEIDRGLYLDSRRIAPLPEFDTLSGRLSRVISRLVGLVPDLGALAAE
ncbi:MAG: N-formylglutamate amidohydrolase [Pseudomonadota bacterium]